MPIFISSRLQVTEDAPTKLASATNGLLDLSSPYLSDEDMQQENVYLS